MDLWGLTCPLNYTDFSPKHYIHLCVHSFYFLLWILSLFPTTDIGVTLTASHTLSLGKADCLWLFLGIFDWWQTPALATAPRQGPELYKTWHPRCEQILTAPHQGDCLPQGTAAIAGISLVEQHLPLISPSWTGCCLVVAPLYFITVCIWQVNLASLQGYPRGPEHRVFEPQAIPRMDNSCHLQSHMQCFVLYSLFTSAELWLRFQNCRHPGSQFSAKWNTI